MNIPGALAGENIEMLAQLQIALGRLNDAEPARGNSDPGFAGTLRREMGSLRKAAVRASRVLKRFKAAGYAHMRMHVAVGQRRIVRAATVHHRIDSAKSFPVQRVAILGIRLQAPPAGKLLLPSACAARSEIHDEFGQPIVADLSLMSRR